MYFTPPENTEQRRERDGKRAGADPQRAHQVEVILAARGIVLEAAQEHAVERGAGAALRRFQQRELHVARRDLDSVEVARDLSVGAEDDADRRMIELLRVGIAGVMEDDG